MLKVFGHPGSTCTRKVLMTLHETNTPHDFNLVDLGKGEHKQPAHLARQPFGQIPTIDDDGFTLYESRAIVRYLNERFNGKLAPSEVQGRALMEKWISVETSDFTPHAMKFIYNYVFKRAQDAAVLEAASAGLERAVGVLDVALEKGPFLAGAQFSLADVTFMPYVEYAMNSPAKEMFDKRPHFSAWWKRVSDRPAWQKTIGR